MSTGGEVANALVCKTSIRRFDPGPVLQRLKKQAVHIYSEPPAFSYVGTHISVCTWNVPEPVLAQLPLRTYPVAGVSPGNAL